MNVDYDGQKVSMMLSGDKSSEKDAIAALEGLGYKAWNAANEKPAPK